LSSEEQFEREESAEEGVAVEETEAADATSLTEDVNAADDEALEEEAEETEDEVGPLPDLSLSADDIFERFGTPLDDDDLELRLDDEGTEADDEGTEADDEASESDQLPPLEFDDEPADSGMLPDPFADDEEEEEVDTQAWYIINCYSGYEHKVRHNLEQRIESMGMHDFIYQVVVPTIEEIELRNGKRRTVERCLYPGYLMVQMNLTDDSWYVVRNTPGVTGFVGMGNRPTPLRTEAVQRILRRMESTAPEMRATFKHGQKVRIIEGPFADFIGVVDDIDEERTKVRVLVSFFGRETPVELDFLQVEKA
jgi:transcription termination/antitermination protein NusG